MIPISKRMLGRFRPYWIMPGTICVRQPGGWVELPRSQIAAVKFESISRIIVRQYNGRRCVINLFRFPNYAVDAVMSALHQSLRQNERSSRGLWEGAKAFHWYRAGSGWLHGDERC